MKKDFEKAKRYIEFAASVAAFAMTVYTLIPKKDKITGIDTAVLEQYTTATENKQ